MVISRNNERKSKLGRLQITALLLISSILGYVLFALPHIKLVCWSKGYDQLHNNQDKDMSSKHGSSGHTSDNFYQTAHPRHTLDQWLQIQKDRKTVLRKFCNGEHGKQYKYQWSKVVEKITSDLPPKGKWSRHLLLQKDYKVLGCIMPKVASTSIKVLMANCTGQVPRPIPDTEMHYHEWGYLGHAGGLTEVSTLPDAEILKTVTNHDLKKFIVVRDPVDRLVSSFREKIAKIQILPDRPGPQPELGYESEDIQRFHGRTTIDYKSVTFGEFVTWLEATHNNDSHLRMYHDICFPCLINYTYIGHTETLYTDMYYIHRLIYGENMLFQMPFINRGDTDYRTVDIVSQLSNKEQRDLLSYVNDDSEAFGYNHKV